LAKLSDEPQDPGGGFTLHGHVVFEVPLHDEGAIAIDVDVVRAVIPLPRDEDEAASPNLADGMMLPYQVTLSKSRLHARAAV